MSENNQNLKSYYRWQSIIYDSTRWSFLFGRNRIVNLIDSPAPKKIIEVGCGTGKNILKLRQKFPESDIYGIDLSEDMLEIAKKKFLADKKIHFINRPYANDIFANSSIDLVFISYCLTMVNPGWDNVLDSARYHLRSGGEIAVVDFDYAGIKLYESYMRLNHVRMENHIVPYLKNNFDVIKSESRKAYMGVWNYFLFTGRKR